MKYLLTLFFVLSTTQLVAENSQSDLQTFFTTKSERQQLNALRNSGAYSDDKKPMSGITFTPLTVEMQGVVIRDSKKPVVFVNNENTLKTQHLSNDVTVRDHKIKKPSYTVPLRVKGEALKLRPGEQWQESDRKVQDKYQIKATNEKPDGMDIKSQIEIIN